MKGARLAWVILLVALSACDRDAVPTEGRAVAGAGACGGDHLLREIHSVLRPPVMPSLGLGLDDVGLIRRQGQRTIVLLQRALPIAQALLDVREQQGRLHVLRIRSG